MNSKRVAIVVIVVIVGIIAAIFVARFAALEEQTAAKSIDEIQAVEGIPVDVVVARKAPVSRYLDIMGTVRGIEQVNITSSLPIDITGIAKREGDAVKKGEVIINLARDRRGKAYHQYAMARQALENAELDLARMQNLFDEGAVSGQALEQARLAYENAKAQYDQAASVVDLVSPIDGVVTMINATIGSQAEPGVTLATVAAIDRMRMRCYVGYDEVVQLSVGQKALVHIPAVARRTEFTEETDKSIEGEITRVSLSSDPDSRLFLVEITVDNRDNILRSGVVTTASILIDRRTDVIAIPADALVARKGRLYVYKTQSNHAEMTEVTVGLDSGDLFEIRSGIAEGDTVVVRGQNQLSDRVRVNVHRVERND
jgi:RND family efflux transporter MFP subunit